MMKNRNIIIILKMKLIQLNAIYVKVRAYFCFLAHPNIGNMFCHFRHWPAVT